MNPEITRAEHVRTVDFGDAKQLNLRQYRIARVSAEPRPQNRTICASLRWAVIAPNRVALDLDVASSKLPSTVDWADQQVNHRHARKWR